MSKEFDYYADADLSKYAGKWVAILDEKVIASGIDFKKVHKTAEKIAGKREPLFAAIPEKDVTLFPLVLECEQPGIHND